ncbi:MAG: PspC domain-containing protein [Bacteroidaceae bacterium]|nr:PspC domain-containing protein [Bacteroidaceae bacterium]
MKKIDQIEIGGHKFYFEEDAFTALDSYICRIKELYRDNGEDIKVADVENRIAAYCHSLKGEEAIITIDIIEKAIAAVGIVENPQKPTTQPDSSDEKDAATEPKDETSEPWYRAMLLGNKLFRNSHDCYLGGLLSGLAAHWGASTTLLRIITFILFLVEPLGLIVFLAYIALWIILPKATSIIDYTRMRRVNNRGSRESVEAAWKENYNITMQEIAQPANNGCLPSLVKMLFFTMLALMALPFIFLILFFIMAGTIFIGGSSAIFSAINIPYMFIAGVIILLSIPLFCIFHWILKKCNRSKPMKRWTKIALVAIWCAILAAVAIGVVRNKEEYSISKCRNIFKAFFANDITELLQYTTINNVTRRTGEFYNNHPVENNDHTTLASLWRSDEQKSGLPFTIESIHTGNGEYNIHFYKTDGTHSENEQKITAKEYDALLTINLHSEGVINGYVYFVWDEKSNTIYLDEDATTDNIARSGISNVSYRFNNNSDRIKIKPNDSNIKFEDATSQGLTTFSIFYYGTQRDPSLLVGGNSEYAGLEIFPSSTYKNIKGSPNASAVYMNNTGSIDTAEVENNVNIDLDKVEQVKATVENIMQEAEDIVKNGAGIINVTTTHK